MTAPDYSRPQAEKKASLTGAASFYSYCLCMWRICSIFIQIPYRSASLTGAAFGFGAGGGGGAGGGSGLGAATGSGLGGGGGGLTFGSTASWITMCSS